MPNVLLTAWQEFKATAMTKAFVFGVIILPIAFYAILGGAFAAGLFEKREDPLVGAIAIVDTTSDDRIYQAIVRRFSPEGQAEEQARIDAEIEKSTETMRQAPGGEQGVEMVKGLVKIPGADVDLQLLPDDADIDTQKQRVRDGELIALIEVGEHTLIVPEPAPENEGDDATSSARNEQGTDPAEPRANSFNVAFGENVKADDRDRIKGVARNAVVDVRFAAADIDRDMVSSMLDRPDAIARAVTEAGETASNEDLLRFVPIGFMFLLFMAIFTGAQYLMMSTIEEKSSRVMEVLLSATSSMQLMSGKILGQCLVGLAVVVLYGGLGVTALVQFVDASMLTPDLIAWQVFYFFTGYVMFAAIFAAVGAAVTEIKEAQALQGPIIGGIILVFYLTIFLGFTNPHSPVTQILSFIPPFTPLVMSMRVAQVGDPVALWQLVATTVIAVVGAWAFVWGAAKIFRVGSLMYGKPPSIPTLLKWIRQA